LPDESPFAPKSMKVNAHICNKNLLSQLIGGDIKSPQLWKMAKELAKNYCPWLLHKTKGMLFSCMFGRIY
jgi:hypothetical protein